MPKISIRGPIIPNNDQWIYDLFDIEATSPRIVQSELADANGEAVDVEINSGGGSVFDGSEIYTALKEYEGNVTVKIVGLAASAASVIAMAGNKLTMAPTAQMMIHNASAVTAGDYRDMDHMSDVLKNVNQTIANAYKMRSGLSDQELLQMMDEETWLTPQQALDYGLIDEVMFTEDVSVVASTDVSGLLPKQVINKIREEYRPTNNRVENEPDNESDILMAKLNLLKLRKVDEHE